MSASDANLDAALHSHGDTHGHGSTRGYIVGFVLSVVLTAVPFWLVMTGVLPGMVATALIIFALALVQILVHVVFFLHLDTRSEGGWTLIAFIFTAVIVVIAIAGSIWIMYHLNTNMMPMPPGTISDGM
ncbi:MAG TPA: cytochrome o ubiquinol oxidase subunit IV [Devosia sp.]|jgi:cytochrome o ubiquinol oxidase operon protein cyoD|nr:cytochrome o ubiquinol oxidase subunit IV [Devosia sp.]